ncbi:poly(A)-binding protein binding protein [Coemansia linderi]|uniref:Poly(A)-binding protein binding protein n=1 Tax=Coemansia linderi TaxID=2663919 RepID=A0ACC1KPI8_9FUNG|nr:poly(A)-binding protein binding protein [Coemansia linderi]
MDRIIRPLAQTRSPVLILTRGLKKKAKIPITLLKDIPRVGQAGAVVHVHKAHMRHELYPKRMADYVIARVGPLDRSKAVEVAAPDQTLEQADRQEKVHSLALRNQETLSRIVKLEPIVFERSVVVVESGTEEGAQAIYGSLTKADVLKELADAHGIVIDKEALAMDEKIKSVGEYTCVVKLIYAGQAELGGSRGGKASRWSSGPPPLSRPAKSPPQANEGASKGPSPAAPSGRSFSTAASGASAAGALGSRTKSQDKSSLTSVQRLIEGEAPEQVEEMHSRLLFLLSYLVGSQVKVAAKDGRVYTGVLDSINPNDAQSVVLRYAYSLGSGKATPPIDTLVVHGDDCLSISGIAAFADGGARESSRTGFKTDADITKAGNPASARELHRWVPDESDALESLESGLGHASGSSTSWDQFATNEQLFGLTTDFDEEIYTTRLDRTRADYKVREREAIRIAHEIQSTPFQNSHVAEERQEVVADNDGGMDEEDRYGAVLRPSGAPGKYVPPYLRGKADALPPAKQGTTESAPIAEPPAPSQALPVANVQGDLAGASLPAQPNNAMAAAALAKLNIRMTGHSPAPELPRSPSAKPALQPSASGARADSPSLAADPAITALSKQPNVSSSNVRNSSKLANLRGFKNRNDVTALNKPMADISEKLNSERERIQLHKQALLKDRVSDLVKFHKTFKLNTPMPKDVAEIIGARNKSPVQRVEPGATANSQGAALNAEPAKDSAIGSTKSHTASATAAAAVTSESHAAHSAEEAPVVSCATVVTKDEANSKKASVDDSKPVLEDAEGASAESKRGDKKALFKFNAKASSFKPSVGAAPFVPKLSAPSSRASSSAGVAEYNPFFGRRILKRAPVSLWSDIFKMDEHQADGDDAPIWPFGASTYRSQFVPDEAEIMMYQPQGFMPQYGYGYYQPYQYPPQMAMLPPGATPRMQASSPYTTAAAAAYGGGGGGGSYVGGPYGSVPGYHSPIMVGSDGRSPVITAMNGPVPPTTHPLSQTRGGMPGGSSSGNSQMAGTPEMSAAMLPGQSPHHQHMLQPGSDSPNIMYGMPPVPPGHMGMVPPQMPFSGMQPGGYMGPPPAHQGYPPQAMPHPMGYPPPYMPGQQYAASPPNMVMMHGTPHPDQGAPTSHPSGY